MGLGRDGTWHGTHDFPSSLFPLGSPVSRKAGKKTSLVLPSLNMKRKNEMNSGLSSVKEVVMQMAHFSSSIANKDA